jgi:hypothetical protein
MSPQPEVFAMTLREILLDDTLDVILNEAGCGLIDFDTESANEQRRRLARIQWLARKRQGDTRPAFERALNQPPRGGEMAG